MKYLMPIFIIFVMVSCQKNEEINETPIEGVIVSTGDFVSSAHPTTGKAKVKNVDGKLKLELSNFKTDAGPDLRIYLAEDLKAKGFVELKAGAPNGTYSVDIPSSIDLKTKKYVLIWCQSFSVLFGSAELK